MSEYRSLLTDPVPGLSLSNLLTSFVEDPNNRTTNCISSPVFNTVRNTFYNYR